MDLTRAALTRGEDGTNSVGSTGKGIKGWIVKGKRKKRGGGKTKIMAKFRDRSVISNKSFSHS